MSLYLIKSKVIFIFRRLPGIFTIAVICILLLTAGVESGSDSNNPASIRSSKPADVNDTNGPIVLLTYSGQKSVKNPFASFMYFVPLVAPTLIDVETSSGNEQQVQVVSYEMKVTSKSFYVRCEFEMLGKGFHKYIFNSREVISAHAGTVKKDGQLSNMIDYIKFEGEGIGRIEVRGTIAGSTRTVTEVDLKFNAKGRKSPVTLGLYNVEPQNRQYKYENRTGELIARVDTFIFKKSDSVPEMGIKLASVNDAAKPNGLLGGLKGTIANWFLNPPKVARMGNDTMLDFGLALLNEKPSFTFPKAVNIKETRTVTARSK
jgi:hypothetical protein